MEGSQSVVTLPRLVYLGGFQSPVVMGERALLPSAVSNAGDEAFAVVDVGFLAAHKAGTRRTLNHIRLEHPIVATVGVSLNVAEGIGDRDASVSVVAYLSFLCAPGVFA